MTISSYLDYLRSTFYSKTDDVPVNKLRHDLLVKNGLINRYSRVTHPDWGMQAESKVIDAALKAGIPAVPLLVKFTDRDTYQVMRRARGFSVGEFPRGSALTPIYSDLATVLRKLHSIPVKGFGPINPESNSLEGVHESWNQYLFTRAADHISYLFDNNLIAFAVVDDISKQLLRLMREPIEFEPRLLHGDLNDHNLFALDGKITDMIDWEDARGGDPIYELAFWATFHPEEIHASLIDAYYDGQEKPADFQSRFWLYHLRVSMSKLVQLHKYGYPDLTRGQDRINLALAKLAHLPTT